MVQHPSSLFYQIVGLKLKKVLLESFYNKTGINKGPYILVWKSIFSKLRTWVSAVSYIFRKSLTLSDR